jgi:hypothetical protein
MLRFPPLGARAEQARSRAFVGSTVRHPGQFFKSLDRSFNQAYNHPPGLRLTMSLKAAKSARVGIEAGTTGASSRERILEEAERVFAAWDLTAHP